MFILDLTPGIDGLGKDNYKTRRETFKFWHLVRRILEVLRKHSINTETQTLGRSGDTDHVQPVTKILSYHKFMCHGFLWKKFPLMPRPRGT